jgi:hypothetical protein
MINRKLKFFTFSQELSFFINFRNSLCKAKTNFRGNTKTNIFVSTLGTGWKRYALPDRCNFYSITKKHVPKNLHFSALNTIFKAIAL